MKTDRSLAYKENIKVGMALASMQGGGIQKAAIRLISEFIRLGYPTSLIVVNQQGALQDEIPENCSLLNLNSQQTRWALWKLVSVLRKDKPDVIISSQTHLNVLLIIARILSGYPKKLVVVEHITFNHEIVFWGKFTERLRPWMIRLFYPLADKVVAVSQASAKSIYRYAKLKKHVYVIWNGLDLDEILKNAAQPISHPWVGNPSVKLLLGMGRLSLQKNFSDLLRAFAKLENRDGYRLIILGDGPEGPLLKSLAFELGIQEQVEFLGFVENPYPFLIQADLFILSSKWEGFANVVIESLACGIPIVATDCPGGPKDILEDKPYAKIVPLGAPKVMADAIQELLLSDIDKSEIRGFAQEFTVQATAHHYLELTKDTQV